MQHGSVTDFCASRLSAALGLPCGHNKQLRRNTVGKAMSQFLVCHTEFSRNWLTALD